MRTLCSFFFVFLCVLFFSSLNAQSSMLAGVAPLDSPADYTNTSYLPSLSTTVTSASSNLPVFRALPELVEEQGSIAGFLQNHVSYPSIAVENGIEGTVIIALEIDADGSLTKVEIVKSLFGPIDQLVLDTAKTLPRLAPAVFNGKAVRKELLIPVHFILR